ncbi:PAS/PAC sensor signal transduction histidine kinase [Candidatus Koribacter versatilis Ellin345]|uniref:histidine kinase n=1 Tax=Koribacter versatilis (strain Ellin345) TaxID=204669 RepID=Q1INZ6_KORVE|nr:PAS domain-containing sensor histidine kinase [Candidatus Koribacter versatilis]ABF41404.1 PAS/PAC sensor signal transduction histidine kinase [Candidatus Koribacter versatilis Ellin345]
MASPQMRVRSEAQQPAERERKAGLRLLNAERSEEIFPLLLEEIIALGHRSAFVARVDFETSSLAPIASLNCSRGSLQKQRSTLFAMENPIVRILHTLQPELIPAKPKSAGGQYVHPIIYRNRVACWEAERSGSPVCLAVTNFNGKQRLSLPDQVCATCDMRAYAAVVSVELKPNAKPSDLAQLSALIELANRYLARIFKVEHYYNRMTDMETTIGQMQTVLESMADPVILTDAQHRVITQNKAAERFFKLPEDVSEGRVRAVELNNLLFSAALSSMAVAGVDSSRDMTLVDAIEGDEVLFEAVSAPSYGPDGRRTGMVTVMRDVTELRRADEELRQNYELLTAAEEVVRQDRDRLNLIIENVGDPIVVCDKDAKIVLLDPLAAELFGEQDKGARTAVHMRNQAKLDAYIAAFTYSFSDRESAPLHLFNPGTEAEVEYDARSGKIYDERGMVAYTVSVLRDLSAVRRLEQLKLERRMLEMEKFAVAGRMAGTIAHEVNNPMEAIKNCIFLLQDAIRDDSQPVYQILKTETERVARIVRQMLGLYRNTEQVGNVDVNSVVEDTLMLFSRQLERAGVRVERDMGDLPPVMGSADQIRQVLSNLVVNAKDSMAQGGKLRIRTRVKKNGTRDVISIVIADSGCGIPPNMVATMFEPFVTTKGERGTGLGLWIVKGIIENHGGKLKVRSKVDHGTVFRMEFPLVP